MIAASSHPFLAKATTDLCIIQQMWTALGVYAPQPKPFAFVLNCCSKLQQNKPCYLDSGNHPQVDFSFVNWQILSIYLSRSWEKAKDPTSEHMDFAPQDQLQAAADRVLRGEKSLANIAIYAERFDVETLGPGDDPRGHKLWCVPSKPSMENWKICIFSPDDMGLKMWKVKKASDIWFVVGGYVKVLVTFTRG